MPRGLMLSRDASEQAHAGVSTLAANPAEASPEHVAIIMDGNHRWASQRRLPGAAGHRAGARNVRPIAEACADLGVRYLTLFAFSTENWSRPKPEVRLLFSLMSNMLKRDLAELDERGVRVNFVGDCSRFPAELQMQMRQAETTTRENDDMILNIAANYGGRWDIAQAARKLARAVAEGRLEADAIDEDSFAAALSLAGLPAPDLCIRTGGDVRISNFLLWDLAYTEFHFADDFWPDFSPERLAAALLDYMGRRRRFGCRG